MCCVCGEKISKGSMHVRMLSDIWHTGCLKTFPHCIWWVVALRLTYGSRIARPIVVCYVW
jgi:hypothetical protein